MNSVSFEPPTATEEGPTPTDHHVDEDLDHPSTIPDAENAVHLEVTPPPL